MIVSEMRKIEITLAVLKDSERLFINLRFSISSDLSGRDLGFSGLSPYLKATKRTLRVRLILFAISALWLRITKKRKSLDK